MRLKYVLRRLIFSPSFTLVTVLTLALGIGANSAIFTVIEAVVLKPLPYPDAPRLVSISHSAPAINFSDAGSAPFLHFTYREEERSFPVAGIWRTRMASITGLTEPEEVRTIDLTADVLRALGVSPAIGRSFSGQDDSPGAAPTVILSDGYWKRRFGGDPSLLGRRIIADGIARDIIGVMPASFRFLNEHAELIRPLQLDRSRTFLGDFSYRAIARLKPGVTLTEAGADAARMIPIAIEKFPISQGYNKQMYYDARFQVDVQPLKDAVVGGLGKTLWILLGTIGLVLLIACANVANLLLVRAEARAHELSVRAAIGAGPMQIAAELLCESLTLGVLGGLVGLTFAAAELKLVIVLAPANLPRLDEISIDPAVLVFTLALSLLAGLLFGLIPAVKHARPQLAAAIRSAGRSLSTSRQRQLTRSALVTIQVALAMILLVGSVLMIRTFQQLRHVNPGFTAPSEIQTAHIVIPETEARDGQAVTRMEQNILDKIAAIPRVASAAVVNVVPMTFKSTIDGLWFQDHPEQATRVPKLRRFKFVSPGQFQTLGIPLIAGRDFTWTDTYDRRPVVILSDNLARELWGDARAALGKQLHETPTAPWREVIGVVGDVREDGVDLDSPQIAYWPLLQKDFRDKKDASQRSVSYAIRSSRTGTQGFVQAIDRAVWSVNPNLPVARVQTLGEIYEHSLAGTSFTLVMLAIAGAMALVIGIVGIYGVVSYSVTERRREIGIRLALGARPAGILRIFVGHALLLAGTGAVFGMAAALASAHLISSLLFHVSAADPVTYGIVACIVILATLLASYFPARRAARLDPVTTLRAE